MPHFGLMDEATMPEDEAALLRARLHLRGGRRRLRQGKRAAAVAALYDALCSGMRWCVLSSRHADRLRVDDDDVLNRDRDLFSALARAGVLGDAEDFERLDSLLDQSLNGEPPPFADEALLDQIEKWLTQLGVMPFDEAALPPEDPDTY